MHHPTSPPPQCQARHSTCFDNFWRYYDRGDANPPQIESPIGQCNQYVVFGDPIASNQCEAGENLQISKVLADRLVGPKWVRNPFQPEARSISC